MQGSHAQRGGDIDNNIFMCNELAGTTGLEPATSDVTGHGLSENIQGIRCVCNILDTTGGDIGGHEMTRLRTLQ
jgi:hypothetical protein